MTQQLHTLPIDSIFVDRTIYPRTGKDWITSYRYSRMMVRGDSFPPITVTHLKSKHILVDGYHRLEAAKTLKRDEISVEVIACKSLDEAYIESIRRNIAHGMPLTPYERIVAAQRLVQKEYTLSQVSEILHMPIPDIERLLLQRVEKVGSETVIRKGLIRGVRLTQVGDPNLQGVFAARTQVHLLTQVITLIEGGFLDIDDPKVVSLVGRLKRALKRYVHH